MAERRLPDGTPTKNVPCNWCGCAGQNHTGGYGTCFGPIEDVAKLITIEESLQPQRVIQCPRRCKAYCPPGGIEIIN